jgi:hypothetical protein
MPYCGRCLNVGRAGKRGAPPEYGPVQPRQRCVLLRQAQPTPNRASMRFAGSRRSWTSYRVNIWTQAVGRSFAGSILLSRLAKAHPAINWLQTVGALERQHPPWILTGKSADLIQVPKLVLGQCELNSRESVLTLVEAFRANDDRGYYRFCQEPCERETCRTTFMCFRGLACSTGGGDDTDADRWRRSG